MRLERRNYGSHRALRAGRPNGGITTPPNSANFSVLVQFPLSHFPTPHPFPNTQRFGGFEAPCNNWRAGCMGRPMGEWPKWAAAEPGGTPRNLTELHGTPK